MRPALVAPITCLACTQVQSISLFPTRPGHAALSMLPLEHEDSPVHGGQYGRRPGDRLDEGSQGSRVELAVCKAARVNL
jgi:hypothetical protein